MCAIFGVSNFSIPIFSKINCAHICSEKSRQVVLLSQQLAVLFNFSLNTYIRSFSHIFLLFSRIFTSLLSI